MPRRIGLQSLDRFRDLGLGRAPEAAAQAVAAALVARALGLNRTRAQGPGKY